MVGFFLSTHLPIYEVCLQPNGIHFAYLAESDSTQYDPIRTAYSGSRQAQVVIFAWRCSIQSNLSEISNNQKVPKSKS